MPSAILERALHAVRDATRKVVHVVSLVALAGCTSAAPPSPLVARGDFSHDRYCPLPRVSASAVDETPSAPERIARDPERLAMWRAAARGRRDERRRYVIRGCDEQAVYECHEVVVGERLGRHGGRRIELGAVCAEQ